MRIRYKVEVYRKRTGTTTSTFKWDTTPLDLTTSISLDSETSITSNADGFTFRLFGQDYPNVLKVDDRVLIYFTAKEDITEANKINHLRFDGVISEMNYTISNSGREIVVKGLNRLDRLLNYTWAAVYEPNATFNSTASDIVQALIQAVNDNNTNYSIAWDSGNSVTTTKLQYYRNYRPVIEMITELSRQSLNGEFNAFFYLDANNNFIWKQKSRTTDGLKLTEGKEIKKIQIIEKVWEVVNAMIFDAGFDPSGRAIHGMYYDETSAAEFGLKWGNTIESFKEISEQLKTKARSGTGWVEQTDQNKKNFSSAYPVTLPWQDRNEITGVPTGSSKVVNNDTEYVNAIRLEARWQGRDTAKAIIDITGNVKPKCEIELSGADWELGYDRSGQPTEDCLDSSGYPIMAGDLVTIISPLRGGNFLSGQTMRCFSVEHEISSTGWNTSLKFEMDIEDAISYTASAGNYRDGVRVR